MAKYIKRPVIVDAVKFVPGKRIDGVIESVYTDGPHEGKKFACINTLEGQMLVSPGDYVITGVKGEKYPCKPDIFKKTYKRFTTPTNK